MIGYSFRPGTQATGPNQAKLHKMKVPIEFIGNFADVKKVPDFLKDLAKN